MDARHPSSPVGEAMAAYAAEERRYRFLLRTGLVVAVAFHAVLFALRFPAAQAQPAKHRDPVRIYRLEQVTLQKPQPAVPSAPIVRVPIPDATPFEPEPVREPEPEVALPVTEPDFIIPDVLPEPPAPPAEPTRPPVRIVKEPRRVVDALPRYPNPALAAGLSGRVHLQLLIDRDGAVRAIDVLRPDVLGFTEAAVEAARQWRYEPFTIDGEPRAVVVVVVVIFNLQR